MTDVDKAQNYDFDPSITDEEREFYLKAYPTPDNVRDRRTHCTTCKMHLGTSPANIENIRMHPILRVTHCPKCQDFYNCGEFSKGEDGSELYCRWCGQGGEVYCCSSCPFVFCKSCITKNLSRGVVADIEQNENWRCFACAPKILWPLRAVHWALMNYIEKQKKEIEAMNLTEEEKRQELAKDRSNCCRLAKAKCGNMSDSMDSIDSALSKRSQGSSSAPKKKLSALSSQVPAAKRLKTGNNEVVCTPDLMSMLEPDCQLTVTPKPKAPLQVRPIGSKVVPVQQNYTPPSRSLAPPPLIQLRGPSVQLRPMSSNAPVIRRTVVSPRTPSPAGSQSPVYHTINGFRIDLNSAAQQGTYRLPNGKLIQVKRQSAPAAAPNPMPSPVNNNWQQRTPIQNPVQRLQISPAVQQQRSFVTVQPPQQQQQPTPAPPLRYTTGMVGSTVISSYSQNGPQIQMVNGGVNVVNAPTQPAPAATQPVQIRPVMVRHTFPNNAYGVARTQFQDQIFNAMEICQHLTGKIQSLTNSNAYKTAKNYLELKELYIHMSYLLTYAIGRFKGLQDKCLGDMRQLGFGNDADSLENGQLAAGVDYVRYGQLEDVELFTANMNSFHNQIYEYRKSLLSNMEHLEDRPPLSPLHDLKGLNDDNFELIEQAKSKEYQAPKKTADWHSTTNYEDDDDDVQEVAISDESPPVSKDPYGDDDGPDFDDTIENEFYGGGEAGVSGGYNSQRSTEDVMRREEESHAYDRKLTRLIQQYPSIWCTRHPDYGNFEVTRKQWRTIASHFTYSADMKMRWKNIRKRYVRIERRMHEGKRFNGYFDKATNFLINRDLPMEEWVQVDCGTGDGDNYERHKLDQIEKELHSSDVGREIRQESNEDFDEPIDDSNSNKPIEIKPLDMKIIHFVKCNPVLWRKSSDSQFHKMDEQTRKSLWMHLWKSVPYVRCSDLIDRWTQLYEMYKTFRLKTIKSERALGALELKYSKYLAKLYFLYKIDEEELLNEDKALIFGDPFDDDTDEQSNATVKVLDKPDDKDFLLALVRAVRHYPAIWDENNPDFHDILLREESWQEIAGILEKYGHKQASDNEDDEIEIVEPKTDTINLDSDEETTSTPLKPNTITMATSKNPMQKINIPAKITPVKVGESDAMLVPMGSKQDDDSTSNTEDMGDFMSATHSLLASMLEVDIIEGETVINPNGQSSFKKQPRKKTTNKPNPTLLKQKRLAERQKLEELKRNDIKLKNKCVVVAKRVDGDYPNFKEKLEELEKQRKEWREEQAKKAKLAQEAQEAEAKSDIQEQEEIIITKNESVESSDEQTDANTDGFLKIAAAVSLTKKTFNNDAPNNSNETKIKECTTPDKDEPEKMETETENTAIEEKEAAQESVTDAIPEDKTQEKTEVEENVIEPEESQLKEKKVAEENLEGDSMEKVENDIRSEETQDNKEPSKDFEENYKNEIRVEEAAESNYENQIEGIETKNSDETTKNEDDKKGTNEEDEKIDQLEYENELVRVEADKISPMAIEKVEESNNTEGNHKNTSEKVAIEIKTTIAPPLEDKQDEIEKTPAANIKDDELSTEELPQLETSKLDAIEAPPTARVSKNYDETPIESCLEKETSDSGAIATLETTTLPHTDNSSLGELCEKMDVDTTPLELPISKSNELQFDAATTTQTDHDKDVEMVTLPIEKDISSNNV